MNVLVTGSGKSGSWQIRGAQLGAAIGATVQVNALDIAAHDIAVVVKRPPIALVERIHRAGVPLVYDVVDAWPQPVGNEWPREKCLAWLAEQIKTLRPAGIVAATQAMAADCAGFGVPVLPLPHHARPGLKRNTVREHVAVVGYEGGEHYMSGRWRAIVETECFERGWQYTSNPDSLSDLDIVVAMRDASGYAPAHWKSNVKLANAQGSGTPFIGAFEAGYRETASGAEYLVSDRATLAHAMDVLTDWQVRQQCSKVMLSAAPALEDVARLYKMWLGTL